MSTINKKCIVSYSGGVGSYMAAKRCIEEYGKDDVELVFADTTIEDESLYVFLSTSTRILGIDLTVLRDGRDPFQVFIDRKYMANTRKSVCSIALKLIPFEAYMKDAADKIKKRVVELVQSAKTPEDVLRLANTLATLKNIEISK